MVKNVLLLYVAAMTLAACSTPAPVTRFGTTAVIEMRNRGPFRAELIAMQDGALVVFFDSVRVLPDSMVRSVRLDLDQNRGAWIAQVGLFEVIPTGVLWANALSWRDYGYGENEALPWALAGTVVTGLTFLAFLSTEPTEYFEWPPPVSKLEELMPYFRHPYGVTPEQLERLRKGPRLITPPR